MDILNEIRTNLATNQNLNDVVKNKIFELIILFHQKFPGVDLGTLKGKVKDVKLGKIGVFERKGPVIYNALENEICFSNKKLQGDYDADHLMMKGILGMISSKENYYGFNKDGSLRALNIGYTEMLANFLVGNEGICDYEEELLATNLISQIIGQETLFQAYFNNDDQMVYKKMLEAEVS